MIPFKCLSPGSMLNRGRYKVIRELNTGGTAVVYEALDIKKQRKCALKVMNLTQRQFEVAMKLSRREVLFSSMIHHENFVKLLDVFSESDRLVLVWELIPGFDLLDSLNQAGGKMTEPMAAYYFRQLLRGVEFMHDNGFCHRDLKAENCMIVKRTQKLKIIDFGLARTLESQVTSTTGTPDYLAPELLVTSRADRHKIDQRAVDVWAMGVILYLLVTGTYPFEDPNDPECFAQVFKNIRKCNLRPMPVHVSSGCRGLLNTIFEVDPKKRIQLKHLANNPWLTHQARIYAEEMEPVTSPDHTPTYSIKNLMVRLNMHKQKESLSAPATPEGDTVPFKSRGGKFLAQEDSAHISDSEVPLSKVLIEDDDCRLPKKGCGFRFIFSKFCISSRREENTFRKSRNRISPY